jgi:hypothetical protein
MKLTTATTMSEALDRTDPVNIEGNSEALRSDSENYPKRWSLSD